MYRWKIEYWLDSGAHLTGIFVGPEDDSTKVANKILAGNPNEFFGLYGENEKHNLLVRKGSVVACDISQCR